MKSKFYYFSTALIGILFLVTSCAEPITNFDETVVPTEKSELAKISKTITQDEINGILFMREEEKLAHDVYYVLNKLFPLRVFQNIIDSEQKHTDAVKNLIIFYKLKDPTTGNGIGEFTNTELQELYNTLIDKGTNSLDSALVVGGIIEETDIIDIQHYIDATKVKNIVQVYSNLLEGSKSHLRAFVKAMDQIGLEYEPRYLSQEVFDAIIEGSTN